MTPETLVFEPTFKVSGVILLKVNVFIGAIDYCRIIQDVAGNSLGLPDIVFNKL